MMKIHSAEYRYITSHAANQTRAETEFLPDEVHKSKDSILIEELAEAVEEIIPTIDVVLAVPIEREQTASQTPKPTKKRALPKKKQQTPPIIRCECCIALPRFVFTQQLSTDATDNSSGKRTKVLDVEAVEIQYSDLQDIPKDTEIVDSDNDSAGAETPIYACKYCQKAYGTSNHLILHTRKCHLCQYCLKGFVLITDLHAHKKEMHSEFDCYVCPAKKFYSSSSLRGHMKRNHGIVLPVHVSLLSINIIGA